MVSVAAFTPLPKSSVCLWEQVAWAAWIPLLSMVQMPSGVPVACDCHRQRRPPSTPQILGACVTVRKVIEKMKQEMADA